MQRIFGGHGYTDQRLNEGDRKLILANSELVGRAPAEFRWDSDTDAA